ncbi:hypothetical protein STCU_12157 [Strigomonas culicis]|uniref:Uncharacterized protein n=1 Tax=Strigomonas culicis TaxID=28005 RepID=S9TG12_9TRYP|nr:hypothetical protein STCU_12157 [Strigomonas culicis]|eukprot:EPY15288.1 hypothetical protein STCU_12157 [Strigomonas culicis]
MRHRTNRTTKVEQAGDALRRDKHVIERDVAVDNVLTVKVAQAAKHASEVAPHHIEGERTERLDEVVQSATGNILHDDVQVVLVHRTGDVPDNVLVLEARECFDLTVGVVDLLRISLNGDLLDGDNAAAFIEALEHRTASRPAANAVPERKHEAVALLTRRVPRHPGVLRDPTGVLPDDHRTRGGAQRVAVENNAVARGRHSPGQREAVHARTAPVRRPRVPGVALRREAAGIAAVHVRV